MQTLLGFSPFILFAVVSNVSVSLALWLAFAAAFAVGIRTFLQKREIRILDAGGIVLFGGLALYSGFIDPEISMAVVRVVVNGGLMLVVLYSLAVKHPFTLPYAKEQTPEPIWGLPVFLQVNMTISAAWAGAFGIMTAADLAALFGYLSLPLDIAIGLLALIGAIVFSVRYPSVVRKRFGLPG
jgi:hypothetical protein